MHKIFYLSYASFRIPGKSSKMTTADVVMLAIRKKLFFRSLFRS